MFLKHQEEEMRGDSDLSDIFKTQGSYLKKLAIFFQVAIHFHPGHKGRATRFSALE